MRHLRYFQIPFKMVLISFLALSSHHLNAATASGKMLADTCAGCHGTDGISMGPATPSIAGYSQAYLLDAMLAFKHDERPSTIMGRIAKGYSDDELEAIATHFSKQKFLAKVQKVDAKLVAHGKKLYTNNCQFCHADNGRSVAGNAGILGGQWLPYLTYTMQDFTSGRRDMPKLMENQIKKLKAKDIEALLHFFASQK